MNKTLKKVLIICVCVVLIVGIAGAIWFWDMTRVIESPSEEILKIHNDFFEKTNMRLLSMCIFDRTNF